MRHISPLYHCFYSHLHILLAGFILPRHIAITITTKQAKQSKSDDDNDDLSTRITSKCFFTCLVILGTLIHIWQPSIMRVRRINKNTNRSTLTHLPSSLIWIQNARYIFFSLGSYDAQVWFYRNLSLSYHQIIICERKDVHFWIRMS